MSTYPAITLLDLAEKVHNCRHAPVSADLYQQAVDNLAALIALRDGHQLLRLRLPLAVETEANKRGDHWSKFRKRNNEQRLVVRLKAGEGGRSPPPHSQRVMVRIVVERPRELDSDNLSTAVKSLRDGVADWLARPSHDADPLTAWRVEYLKATSDHVTIEVLPI
jgi:hypothetical protein